MTTFKRIEKASDVTKAIASIANRAKKLDHDIHEVGVSCMYHADKHGDVTLMQALVKSLGKSQRRNALLAWAIHFGKFKVDDTGKSVIYDKTATTDLEGAEGNTPWDFTPEPAFQPWDMDAELAKFLKKASKAAEDSRNKVDTTKLEKLAQLQGA